MIRKFRKSVEQAEKEAMQGRAELDEARLEAFVNLSLKAQEIKDPVLRSNLQNILRSLKRTL